MKKVLILALALVLLVGIAAHGTFGLFSDTETSTGNTFTAWVEECVCYKFNVSDFTGNNRRIFYYDSSASFIDFFDLDADNGHPSGVASVGDSIYVLDQSDKKVYKYDCCGNILGVSKTLIPSGGGSIANPIGLAIYETETETEMWVVSANDKKIYFYLLNSAFPDTDNGNPIESDGGRDIDLVEANTGAIGLAIDSTYLYVLDFKTSGSDKEMRFYRYDRITGVCGVGDISKVLKDATATGSDIGHPGCTGGAMFDGTFPNGSLWVVDSGTDKVYRYDNIATSLFPDDGSQDAAFEFNLDGANDNASGV